ncbi:hypothetical protein KP509_12G009700 [Ceratopteris richardii]|nr:hypothetical protein KP509_12G009700 [Ceratopteris richardii]
MNGEVAKAVVLEGGISILAALSRSPNRWVAEEVAGSLWESMTPLPLPIL